MNNTEEIVVRYRKLLAEVDAWFEQCSLVAGDCISCRQGCSACCRGLFDITILDAFMLRLGFEKLQPVVKERVLSASKNSINGIRRFWPDFRQPYLMNIYPEEEWDMVMPDEDETPCPLLGQDGLCLVYDNRPMTCRLHGIPLVDTEGEVLFDEWCSLNFVNSDPLQIQELRFHFNELFVQEQLLFREFTRRLLGQCFNELDTVIPAAVLLDFGNISVSVTD